MILTYTNKYFTIRAKKTPNTEQLTTYMDIRYIILGYKQIMTH